MFHTGFNTDRYPETVMLRKSVHLFNQQQHNTAPKQQQHK